MEKTEPSVISEFPLSIQSAKNLIRDLSENHSTRIKFSKHARERLLERDITLTQVFSVLSSRSSRFFEQPWLTPSGDWAMSLEGIAAGDSIRIPLVLKRLESDPSVLIITVIGL
ncbi:DUF4258 domain-containing protein [Oceanospirillum sediminis]|uniref:DUF4258 domain-containing protein n=1 Tax=Oceanospirillum sediminis TaxID=2760088 RepID=A0A839ILI7_9GAMM|nr:DUF4258 domain-containing protein [Oceanospirillum sediminis]MBB1485560.1 DUF4258 domain-containing protein [Oceanospirillum sediminis]